MAVLEKGEEEWPQAKRSAFKLTRSYKTTILIICSYCLGYNIQPGTFANHTHRNQARSSRF